MNMFDLTGRVAIVTGGNGGIGLGMARGLAGAGAGLMIVGRDQTKNADAVKELSTLGVTAVSVAADLADEASCRSVVEETEVRPPRHPGEQCRDRRRQAASVRSKPSSIGSGSSSLGSSSSMARA